MKKIVILISALLLATVNNSCNDAYEIVQAGEFDEAATFRTISDMQSFLIETYDRINTAGEIEIGGILTDEVAIGAQNGGQNTGLYRFVFNPTSSGNSNSVASVWLGHYTAINYANRLLKGAERITPEASELAEYNSIIAQARAIRAFCHFQLLTYFSTDLKNDAALGVILMDYVPEVDEQKQRNTNGEVFALINSDLDFAESNLGTVNPFLGAANTYKLISKDMINALRARMNLYRGNHVLAEQYADEVINNSGLSLTLGSPFVAANFYTTASNNPYRRMFADLQRGEVIFALDRSVNKSAIAGIYYFNQTNFTGGPYMEMSRSLFNLMASRTNDVRINNSIDPTSTIDPAYATNPDKTQDVLLIDKYPGKPTGAPLNSDLKVFRLSEMFLIKAECRVVANDLPGATALIDQIKTARRKVTTQPITPTVFANATSAWKGILEERRIELCFEGHRYIDLKRLGVIAGEQVSRDPRDTENMPVTTIAPTDHRFTFPIPSAEINGNGVITQNPEY